VSKVLKKEVNMKSQLLIVAITTQIAFLVGEIPFAGYLQNVGFSTASFSNFSFWLFTITRFIGISGQMYLWSATELGRVAAILGGLGIIISNLAGVYLLHQKALSMPGYVGIVLAVISVCLLTTK
jgi:multidrug transporter EmrE-like cation transporter